MKLLHVLLMHYIWDRCLLKDNLRRIFTQRNARNWKEQISKILKRDEIADAPSRVTEILSALNIDVSKQGSINRLEFEKLTNSHLFGALHKFAR